MPFLAPIVASITSAITSVATAIGFSAATSAAIASSVIQFGASFLLSAAATALFGKKPTAQDVSRELSQQTTAPAYRFVYGETRATGTPAGVPVKGEYIYGAWVLNSRVSDLPSFKLFLDKREVTLSGNAFDLSGDGATATENPFAGHVTAWISRGDHIAPPAKFTTEAPYMPVDAEHLWKITDRWRGLTMIWLKLKAGSQGERQERWPSAPPLVEVEGKFSKVYDPRDVAQDPDDASTWEWSDTHALCVRDALRQNPIRGYRESQIHESFTDGADVCDEAVALNAGGTEARYSCAGTVIFTEGEIEDQLNPMMISGAADFIRVGGKLGYAAGEYRQPSSTVTYLLGDGFEFPDMLSGSQLANHLRVSYVSPARGYETAELQPWSIPGALSEDGGIPTVKTLDLPFCPSATQAMRVRKITGLRQRRQERINGGTLPPESFDLVGGSTVNVALPSPYSALDGVYEVESIHPGLDPMGENGGVAMRLPAALVKHSADIYEWTPADDEEEVFDEAYNGTRSGSVAPGAISVTTGAAVNLESGGTVIPRIRFAFDPSPSASVSNYEWEYRRLDEEYTTGGIIDGEVRDGSGQVFGFLNVSVAYPGFPTYDIRVRSIGSNGRSSWVEIEDVVGVVGITLDIPTEGSAVAEVDEITAGFRTPNDPDFRAIEIFGSDTDDINAASIIGAAIYTTQNVRVNITESGLGTSVTRYYFARSRGDYASASGFTASVSATTDP